MSNRFEPLSFDRRNLRERWRQNHGGWLFAATLLIGVCGSATIFATRRGQETSTVVDRNLALARRGSAGPGPTEPRRPGRISVDGQPLRSDPAALTADETNRPKPDPRSDVDPPPGSPRTEEGVLIHVPVLASDGSPLPIDDDPPPAVHIAIYENADNWNRPSRALLRRRVRLIPDRPRPAAGGSSDGGAESVQPWSAYWAIPWVDLPPRFAVSAFLDSDGDGELSRNLVGIPSEPYGFSNSARSITGPPSFEAAETDRPDPGYRLTLPIR